MVPVSEEGLCDEGEAFLNPLDCVDSRSLGLVNGQKHKNFGPREELVQA